SMSCENTDSCATTSYGVTNDGLGNLGGYAWGENVGWISFSCANTATCGTASYGVSIGLTTGVFAGNAWGENIGWITFSDDSPVAYQVRTGWTSVLAGGDKDQDGCTNERELLPKADAAIGGGRDPNYYWDFMDMWVNKQKDRRVNIIDIGVIVQRFGAVGDANGDPLDPPEALTGYHVSADRSPPIGVNLWNAGPPDGSINIIDIAAAVVQFGHTCA
ncbi:MAG: hypothetical protein IIB21_00670, partial [Chloroflexi bacterium]|nr:hypothetical protein [Chloroflexota bacterium]